MEDFHLLGFNIDLQQRTITYIQPTQPWKIRDHTSAGSQRLALSGLASRLHSIYTYTFPPNNATAAAEALVNLYAQKGHDLHACRRFLREKRSVFHRLISAPITACCVCVSHPGSKGFPRSCISTTNTACFTPFTDAKVPTARTVFQQGAHGSVPGVSQRSSRFRLGYRKRTLFRRTCNLNF